MSRSLSPPHIHRTATFTDRATVPGDPHFSNDRPVFNAIRHTVRAEDQSRRLGLLYLSFTSPIRASVPRSLDVDVVNIVERRAVPANHQGVRFSVAANGKFTVVTNSSSTADNAGGYGHCQHRPVEVQGAILEEVPTDGPCCMVRPGRPVKGD